ncbi:right-handed parallel beta-helix repeat-containing protein [Rudaea cellulosilytica]|uniref:right-handed parallel beta-helix repeat-containing protein n=1 Tax=Rudaea cellulosilytica TaxID=540746 RepID=UPI00037901A5|nr:right-handed parallel beta-helix repeat-containing protein [Rudaea cellulosilytica]
MSQPDSVSRRQFLCEAVCAGLLVATGIHANVASASVDTAASAEIHVNAANGDDSAPGSVTQPLKTISAAAAKAMPGDTIVVHAGVYREWVRPPRGGTSDSKRITYRAAPGEKVVITGSDSFTHWEKVSGDTWKLVIPNAYFGAFNPYVEKVGGDWFDGQGRDHRRGMVYVHGEWLPEALDLDAMTKVADGRPAWFALVDQGKQGREHGSTTIYARFPAATDPNSGAVEVCVRPTVFTPEKIGIDYITLSGFELRNAATNWAAPTMGQRGLVSAYWNKGWIIENNEICYSRCSGVALGKYSDEFDGKRGTTDGYYLTINDALKTGGWTKEKIGSHIVRNNRIHHCGQTGVVGSLGCAFSQVVGNEISDCNTQDIWDGAEMAGIKFHGAIDVVIADNHIHHIGNAGGIWLDWMAQGTRITGNLFHDNSRDLFTEVDHGPFLVANNLFLSPRAYLANSQGAAFAHNLVTGSLQILPDERRTPYMKPHATDQIALHDNPVGDVRWINNILAKGVELFGYNAAGKGWECHMTGNVFAKGAWGSRFDKDALNAPVFDIGTKLVQKADGWYLTLATDAKWKQAVKRPLVTTALLGKAKIPQQEYTLADGSPMMIDTDYLGAKRDTSNPFPGPFESHLNGEVKVWPKAGHTGS